MKTRHVIFGVALSLLCATPGWTQSGFSFTGTTTNSQSFGFGSLFSFFSFFSFSGNGTSFTQRIGADGTMCQNFRSTSGGVTQLINGNTVSSSTAAPGSPSDPCL